jgi:hypothetical protein
LWILFVPDLPIREYDLAVRGVNGETCEELEVIRLSPTPLIDRMPARVVVLLRIVPRVDVPVRGRGGRNCTIGDWRENQLRQGLSATVQSFDLGIRVTL